MRCAQGLVAVAAARPPVTLERNLRLEKFMAYAPSPATQPTCSGVHATVDNLDAVADGLILAADGRGLKSPKHHAGFVFNRVRAYTTNGFQSLNAVSA
jgi:hypothetical protein